MTFRKIKFDGAEVVLEWSDRGQKWEKTEVFTGRELPHPDFTEALAALRPVVLEMLELPDDYGEGLAVRSVSLSVDADGNAGAVVTCLKTLGGLPAPLVLNTPHVSEREGAEGGCTMPDELRDLLEDVTREALAYLRGEKRAQADLFAAAPARVDDDTRVTLEGPGGSVTMTSGEFAQAARRAGRGARDLHDRSTARLDGQIADALTGAGA